MEFQGTKKIDLRLEIAPLIDVVFLLLIFYMLTSSFVTSSSIDISLPEAASSETSVNSEITVVLSESGNVQVNGDSINLNALEDRIRSLLRNNPKSKVLLQSDAKASVQLFISMMDAVRLAGATNIDIATEKTEAISG